MTAPSWPSARAPGSGRSAVVEATILLLTRDPYSWYVSRVTDERDRVQRFVYRHHALTVEVTAWATGDVVINESRLGFFESRRVRRAISDRLRIMATERILLDLGD
jgi:hypothetical protein